MYCLLAAVAGPYVMVLVHLAKHLSSTGGSAAYITP
jgi:hypothetical protein